MSKHYSDVIKSAIASEITGVSIVCPTVYSGTDQRLYQSSASPVKEIHWSPVDSPHKGPVTRIFFIWWRHHACDIINHRAYIINTLSPEKMQTTLRCILLTETFGAFNNKISTKLDPNGPIYHTGAYSLSGMTHYHNLDFSNRPEIWQTPRQQHCWGPVKFQSDTIILTTYLAGVMASRFHEIWR